MDARLVGLAALLAGCGRMSFDAIDGSLGTDSDSPIVDALQLQVCPNLVSGYAFDDPANLGVDSIGTNHMADVIDGTPLQSTDVPPGSAGHSVLLDGVSGMCISSGYTFQSASDHTLCWWAKPTALHDTGDQFAQFCQYDTWTAGGGTDYRWTINNCSGGTRVELVVPNVYSLDAWVNICETYESATQTRTVMIVTDQVATYPAVDPVPIDVADLRWCIGSYGGGGFWTGLIHRPMWFNRILTETEIRAIHAAPLCFP